MRIISISDTHNKHKSLDIPDGDVLIHSGDITNIGDAQGLAAFNAWGASLPHKWKICIAGNHDSLLEHNPGLGRILLSDWIYLQDEEVMVDGLKIYGSPWSVEFGTWSFMAQKGNPIKRIWDMIPDDTDILVTHGPAYGILDRSQGGIDCGCEELLKRTLQIKPMIAQCGHIHEAYGVLERDGIKFINASSVTRFHDGFNKPIITDI